MPGNLYVITGPSGVGKTTVAHELLKRRENLSRLITCTTRAIRPGEKDGVDYHFLSKDQFAELVAAGEMFEYAHHYGNDYGNRTADLNRLLESGKDVLMVLDVVGARTVHQKRPDAFVIFITPDSPDILRKRIERRDPSKAANVEERLSALPEEMAFAEECQAVVENQDGKLDETIAEVERQMDAHAQAVS